MTEATTTTAPATAATAIAAALIAIELSEPIQRGDTHIATLQLRKPKAGELRGLSLQDVLTADISTILKLIPRITVPPLTQPEADELSPADLAEIGGAVRGFFMTTAERRVIEAMVAEQQPTS